LKNILVRLFFFREKKIFWRMSQCFCPYN